MKDKIILAIILLISVYLRFYNMNDLMQFIPDQGWFYLSARDMILTGKIPLVGPPTSHPWIHHGAHWTYVLGILLWIGNFNPISPGYFIGALGVFTVFIFYKTVLIIFDKKTAQLATLLYATSPLLVMNARIPYHTSPIPFFVILLLFSTYKWVKGNVWFFPVIIFLLAILYNHEITTFVFAIAIGLIVLFGFLKKEKWFYKTLRKEILFASFIGFFIPMIPFFVYDISHGYKQTVGFVVWMIYRVVKLPVSLVNSDFVSNGSNPSTLAQFFSYYQQLLFQPSSIIAGIIFSITVLYLSFSLRQNFIQKNKIVFKISASYAVLFLFLAVGLGGLFIHRIPIEADTLLIAPFILILTSQAIFWLVKNYKVSLVIVCILSIGNMYILFWTSYFTNMGDKSRISQKERMYAVMQIIKLADHKKFKIQGRGELSDLPVFTMPYEYLLWWKGHPPSQTSSLTIEIYEKDGDIFIKKLGN